MSSRIVVKGLGLFGRPKKVEEEQLHMLSSMLNAGEELEVEVITKNVTGLCLYEYGPLLTLHEIHRFCESFVTQIKTFRQCYQEIFAQMLNIFSLSKETDYVVKEACILVRNTPYCALIKFGNVLAIPYVLDLDTHALYVIKEKSFSISYVPGNFDTYKQMYNELKVDFDRKETERIRANFGGFKESLKHQTAEFATEMETSQHNCLQHEKKISKLMVKANETEELLKKEEEKTAHQMQTLTRRQFFGGSAANKGDHSDRRIAEEEDDD